jgi:chemosensory pili system protein ChpA (sensor histidine kinase/response regulator)
MSATAEQDLGPLAWVLDEVRKSLEAATKAVSRFMRDADAARLSDLEELDTSALRIARQQLHQACGALEMVGVTALAQVLRSMEAAVNRFVQRPEYCTQEAATTLERTHFALMEFLEAVGRSAGLGRSLFPQYRETQVLAGNDKAHPADLWLAERRAREPRWTGTMPEPLAYGPHARAMLDGVVLRMVKSDDREAAAQMSGRRLRPLSPKMWRRAVWKIAAAFLMLRHAGSSPQISTSSAWLRACSCSTPAWPRATACRPPVCCRTGCSSARRPSPASRPATA